MKLTDFTKIAGIIHYDGEKHRKSDNILKYYLLKAGMFSSINISRGLKLQVSGEK